MHALRNGGQQRAKDLGGIAQRRYFVHQYGSDSSRAPGRSQIGSQHAQAPMAADATLVGRPLDILALGASGIPRRAGGGVAKQPPASSRFSSIFKYLTAVGPDMEAKASAQGRLTADSPATDAN
ncbi:hypothetical protein ON010_g16322 [Phytophthora cinnamomi]|nr:hypothetical protein ON010_g16322 [Phytophthora cinnamomi]